MCNLEQMGLFSLGTLQAHAKWNCRFSEENLQLDFGWACSVPNGNRPICSKLHTWEARGFLFEMSDRDSIRAILGTPVAR